MDHQALPAVDIPIHAEPDHFILQLLEAIGSDKSNKAKTRPGPKGLSHWNERITPTAPTSRRASMTLWEMAMDVRDFAQNSQVTFARLPIGWPGEAYEFDGPLSFLGNDGGGAVGTGPGHQIGAASAFKAHGG